MVKKIVALAIAFVLMLAVPLYDTITAPAPSAVDFGQGTGTSAVITTPDELNDILANIPDINSYLTTEDMTTLNPSFKTFTMTEEGTQSISQKSFTTATRTETDYELTMCFTNSAIYYRAIGTSVVKTSHYESSSFETLKSVDRTTMDYDMEVYYSKAMTLIKFNELDTKYEESTDGISFSTPEASGDMFSEADQMSFLKKAKGKWMQLVELTEAELMEKFGDLDFSQEPSPDQMGKYFEYMAYEYANQFAKVNTEALIVANQANLTYLKNLGAFITTNLDNFDKNLDTYTIGESAEDRCAYMNALVGMTAFKPEVNAPSVEASFNLNSSDIKIEQDWYIDISNTVIDLDAVTTISNVGNTIANVKDQKIISVYDALKGTIVDYLEDMYSKMADGGVN